MYRTLGQLRESINELIVKHGEHSGCAAFVYTKDDVFTLDSETGSEVYYSAGVSQEVLYNVGDSSYIYEQIGEFIDDELRKFKKQSSSIQ